MATKINNRWLVLVGMLIVGLLAAVAIGAALDVNVSSVVQGLLVGLAAQFGPARTVPLDAKRVGSASIVLAVLLLLGSGCAHGAVAANDARMEACQALEQQIEDLCAAEAGECTGPVSNVEARGMLSCTRATCDAIRSRLENVQ